MKEPEQPELPFWFNEQTKPRFDGKGDAWANMHRAKLGHGYHMQDQDVNFGFQAFAVNSAEKFFAEYVPDDFRNYGKAIREFRTVALFDRKLSIEAIDSQMNAVSRAFYLWLCRTLGRYQAVEPKFFYIIGDQQPPWKM